MSSGIAVDPRDKQRVGNMLIGQGIIQPEQLEKALEVQAERGGKIVETMIHLGYLDVTTVSTFLASLPGVASVDLARYRVPRELCDLVPREFAIEHEVFPIDRLGNGLTVAMAFPIDLETIRRLEDITGMHVNALLCNPEEIRQAIRRYYASPEDQGGVPTREQMETGLRLESIVMMIQRIHSLPALPQTVQRVREATMDPNTSLRDVTDAVSTDPGVSAKLLQLANSAAYGFLSRIDNVQSAITLLGMRETYMAVLSSAIIDLSETSKHFDHARYWKSAVFCAAAARTIGAACGHKRSAAVFTSGLLADIGSFALSEVTPIRYAKINPDLRGQELVEAEEDLLGIGHPEAAHILAVHWKLPDEIAETLRFHHRPELAKSHQEITAIIALAAVMTDAYMDDVKPSEDIFGPCAKVLATLKLSAGMAADAYAATRASALF